jgi:transposase
MKLKVVAIDLAKQVFALYGRDGHDKVRLREKVRRESLRAKLRQIEPTLVVMEACGGAHFWAQEFEKMGHTVRMIAPQYVKPYVKTNKNDFNDAEGICEAALRPNMRFVARKSVEQLEMQAVHRVHEQYSKQRTALANEMRGILTEFGVILPLGINKVRTQVGDVLEDAENGVPDLVRNLIGQLRDRLRELDASLLQQEKLLKQLYQNNELCQRAGQLPGVGVMTATAVVAAGGDLKQFRNGRGFAAWLGLVPRQHSSGGKTVLQGISKRGNCYLRKLLVHGARSLVRVADKKTDARNLWIQSLKQRRGYCRTTVAVANKQARMLWVLLARGESYKPM